MRFLVLLTVAAVASATFGAAARAQSEPQNGRFLIGKQLQFTGPTSVAGTFTIAGMFSDSGSESGTFTVTPGSGDSVNVTGDETLTGAKGAITLHFKVVSRPASDPSHEYDIGTEVVTAATGAYNHLVGKRLSLQGVLNLDANTDTEIADSRWGV
jgi:hypothetical protein